MTSYDWARIKVIEDILVRELEVNRADARLIALKIMKGLGL